MGIRGLAAGGDVKTGLDEWGEIENGQVESTEEPWQGDGGERRGKGGGGKCEEGERVIDKTK